MTVTDQLEKEEFCCLYCQLILKNLWEGNLCAVKKLTR